MASIKNLTLRKVVKSKNPDWKMPQSVRGPELRLEYNVLPAAKDWKNGEHYMLVLKVKQTESDERGARFEVVRAGSHEAKDVASRISKKVKENY